ncbi:hypothetical protein [Ancylobacter oerskovii]|uniref:Neprosin domain-containing protein n=1 Tax=Ancylobacter oerskovii TaxID=459519 RepID=A0ABW4Z4U9_9HYPH|nr:hypothetical protein [Ancylobacter oerskovii]MBS7543081.1 hypothetical protein [Ancylobacter oerskovii]
MQPVNFLAQSSASPKVRNPDIPKPPNKPGARPVGEVTYCTIEKEWPIVDHLGVTTIVLGSICVNFEEWMVPDHPEDYIYGYYYVTSTFIGFQIYNNWYDDEGGNYSKLIFEQEFFHAGHFGTIAYPRIPLGYTSRICGRNKNLNAIQYPQPGQPGYISTTSLLDKIDPMAYLHLKLWHPGGNCGIGPWK